MSEARSPPVVRIFNIKIIGRSFSEGYFKGETNKSRGDVDNLCDLWRKKRRRFPFKEVIRYRNRIFLFLGTFCAYKVERRRKNRRRFFLPQTPKKTGVLYCKKKIRRKPKSHRGGRGAREPCERATNAREAGYARAKRAQQFQRQTIQTLHLKSRVRFFLNLAKYNSPGLFVNHPLCVVWLPI